MEFNWRRESKSPKERYEDDFLFPICGKEIRIHQGKLESGDHSEDLGN